MSNIWYLYFAMIVIFEIIAIWLLTEWSKYDKIYLIILGVLSYVVVAIFFALLMRKVSGNNLAIINAFWQVIGLIAVTCIGIFVFAEKLQLYQWIGLVLSVIALVFLTIGEISKD